MRWQTSGTKQAHFGKKGIEVMFLALALCRAPGFAQTIPQQAQDAKSEVARRTVVSIPDRKLALIENGRVVKIYNIAVGAPESPSPSGEFQIRQRLGNPTYYKPSVVIGPGNANPLGTRWMGLNVKGFAIHGTNRPDSVGKNTSHGCIRLRNRDAEDLFVRVKVGDRVSLIAERDQEVAQIFGGPTIPTKETGSVVAAKTTAAPVESAERGDE